MWVMGRSSNAVCARPDVAGKQRNPRLPTTVHAVILVPCLICSPRERARLRLRDGEVQVARQRLVRDLVGDLDLQPVIALGERRERNGLSALQLMSRGKIELWRQRLRVQVLR